ncbi:SLC13 family permease [Haloferula sp.]|uniref:SLC13 family permease n=1 Tax=Haloferula sp. TaxID=2497595 RepID=UPI003C708665
MTWEIAAVLAILAVALVFFVTEKLPMDVVALLVLGTLAVSGLVTLEEALAGFSNPAVVTVWAMFILSAGLSATGVADFIGRQVLKLVGSGEVRIIIVIMLTTGVLSAFMNNIGVAALMLPVVMDIARKTQTSPSRLLMPMAYSSLLGGLTTLVGTPPNLVASGVLQQAGYQGFSLFEFAPIGVPAMVIGTLFVALIGRHLLPSEMPESMKPSSNKRKLQFSYELDERRFKLKVAADSPLHKRPLRDCGLAQSLGLNVLAIQRGSETLEEVDGSTPIHSGDTLLVQGRPGDFRELLRLQAFEMASGQEIFEILSSDKIAVVKATLANESPLVGLTVGESNFRRRFGVHILEINRPTRTHRKSLADLRLRAGESLLLQGRRAAAEALKDCSDFSQLDFITEQSLDELRNNSDSLVELVIPEDSQLPGSSIAESGLGNRLSLDIIGIARKGGSIYYPDPDEKFRPGDRLLTLCEAETFELLRSIQSLEFVDESEAPSELNDDRSGLAEATLSPGSSLVGKTVRELDFRQHYGLIVRAIWRKGRAYRTHLHRIKLEFGDALLLVGPREKVEALADDPDFILLSRTAYKETARNAPWLAGIAAVLMLAVVASVLSGWLPIAIAAVSAGALMVALRCLTMDDAYRAIEWKSVFLIAGMIPLGTAMQTTGAASWLAQGVTAMAAPFGIWGLMIALYLLTMLATTIVPTTALVLIMAPIAIEASTGMNLDPKLLIMAVAMAASASFTSPISHPANVLVMGPGGYRFTDYVRMGAVLALVVMITVLPLVMWKYG